jgi:hypothetical protein
MLIDCDTCRMRDIACDDCVINLFLGAPQDSLDLDADETAALGALAAGGLTPPLRLVPVHRSHPPDIRWHQRRSAPDRNPAGDGPPRCNPADRHADRHAVLRSDSISDSAPDDSASPSAVSGL